MPHAPSLFFPVGDTSLLHQGQGWAQPLAHFAGLSALLLPHPTHLYTSPFSPLQGKAGRNPFRLLHETLMDSDFLNYRPSGGYFPLLWSYFSGFFDVF